MHRQRFPSKDKGIHEHSVETADIIKSRRPGVVVFVEQIIIFGHVRYLSRRAFLIGGASLNVVNFVSAVWQSVARMDAKHCIIDCVTMYNVRNNRISDGCVHP